MTLAQAQSVLVALAPLVGTARVTSAAGNIIRAMAGITALSDSPVPEQRSRDRLTARAGPAGTPRPPGAAKERRRR